MRQKISKGEDNDEIHDHVEVRGRLLQNGDSMFLKTGAPPPKGVKTVGRWHVPGTQMGWHLVESDDMTALAETVAEWADVIDIEVNPVIEDAAAAEAVKRVYGK